MSIKENELCDEDLVEQIRKHDQELYVVLVQRYEERLMRYAQYILRDRDRATDVVQEAFIKAYVNLNGFNTKKSFSSWIYRITHNEAMNHIRRHKNEVHTTTDSHIENIIAENQDIPENMNRTQVQQMVNSCVDSLPLPYREPLVLYYFEDNSYEQISDILRLPLNTVGSRLRRGKLLLRTLCQNKL